MISNPLKADIATTQKQRLQFARILVEVEPNQIYPNMVMFENECGAIIEQEVSYEWKPIFCKVCGNFGHDIRECRKQLRQDKAGELITKETGNNNTKGDMGKEKPEEQQQKEARDITPIANGSNNDKQQETKIKRAKANKAALNLCTEWSYTTNHSKHNAERI
ncbi:PREDICTED: uncharacterized protein LOC109231740 [Nicotiana attenuata]|uniref:uncharacterized protein LOC109231740 n=1 Tax=Nicotiana attenuata TaxID=49451 RepID=UPI0009050B20|nr:PREDICTED: uncharacterized protein LOC109231740 [Nicotiana attenuata]